MISKLVFLISFSLFLLGKSVADTKLKAKQSKPVALISKKKTPEDFTPRSCLDYFNKNYRSNGYYKIYDMQGSTFTVYCDMTSEAGAAWTLAESYALKNAHMKQFRNYPLKVNGPVNENSPNWKLYRMNWSQMNHVKTQSTHWRITCSFPTYGVDYTDYVRGKLADFDVMTYVGSSLCKKVEYINVRGLRCAHCTSGWWQGNGVNTHPAHVSPEAKCEFKTTQGAVPSEDNFGYYGVKNVKFRCTSGPHSTTNVWFGGYQ